METTPAPRPSLTDWVVLAIVAEGESHGFLVAKELAPDSQLGDVWTVPRPLVYRSIERLTELGWIEETRHEPGDQGPRRTVVRSTRTGRRRLAAWLQQPVAHPRDIRTELLVKVMLLERRGKYPAVLAQRQLESFAETFAAIARRARAAEGPERIVARWRVENCRAIERTLRSFTGGREALPK